MANRYGPQTDSMKRQKHALVFFRKKGFLAGSMILAFLLIFFFVPLIPVQIDNSSTYLNLSAKGSMSYVLLNCGEIHVIESWNLAGHSIITDETVFACESVHVSYRCIPDPYCAK